ncbi:MAG: hypothetical protein A3I89_02070 [Candidatus Harrisonbacteria bacterium RIFCSPLOWO2_02_FULL_41_11]|uniref:Uncharacterized protein n=1 Tax=Candidatus Harrisonbacteria bacterium RIFCSPHIGHO2_02_FULL_42_16 TaxID=1798404 RepID=A0A1G1ZGE9_9BACT|nr:MAG: hypothetical protein A3B92_01700 [Candidatus Harrisonbacteria bacterium RIFCSPHIGHO2_02_FULL_42_16]OGY65645.1 MAG: hypothetical protein A3I89_02070 [Candidatus Harrisonbacteria bacterium RIFCSPLOWO2_02_FULL_41_11]
MRKLRKLRLAVVSKDNGDTKMLLPIAREARQLGHKVIILAEGVGVDHYIKQGVKTFFRDVSNPDPKTDFDLEFLLSMAKPDAVLVGFPGPNNLSGKISAVANDMGIPLIGVEDYWGGVKRYLEFKYSLLLTIDDYAAEIARNALGPKVPISVIGNHAVSGLDYRSPEAVLAGMEELKKRFNQVFVFGGGGGKHTTEELKLLVPSLQKTPGNWCLVPRYHPNLKKKLAEEIGDQRTFQEVWDELLLPLGDRVVRLDAGNSDDMAVVSDAYFSGLGSSMNTAIYSGKPTIAVVTAATMEAIRDSKLDAVPAVELGGAKTLTEVQDLQPLLVPPNDEVRKKFKPLDANLAVRKIEKLLF